MSTPHERLYDWLEESKRELRSKKLGFLVVAPLSFIGGMFMSRLEDAANKYLDAHKAAAINGLLTVIAPHSWWRGIAWAAVTSFVLFVAVLAHAYWETRPRHHGIAPDLSLNLDYDPAIGDALNAKLLGLTEMDKVIVLHNRSQEYVCNIALAPIELRTRLTFDHVNEIEPGKKARVVAHHWDEHHKFQDTRPEQAFLSFIPNAEVAARRGWAEEKATGFSDYVLHLPVSCTYESTKGAWQLKGVFTFHPFGPSSFRREYIGPRLRR